MSDTTLKVSGKSPFERTGTYEVFISILDKNPSAAAISKGTYTPLWRKPLHLYIDDGAFSEVLGDDTDPLPACEAFEQVLRIDPDSVDTMLKLGYARFHLDDYAEALNMYDRILELDVTNSEAWNLKSLVHYEQKNYAKALDCTEKSIDSDPTFGMAWYNKACYLSILNQIPQSIDSLKRSIEIDVKNARKSVKDRDFINASRGDLKELLKKVRKE